SSQVRIVASFLGTYYRVVSFSGHQYLPTEVIRDLFLVRIDQERIVKRVTTSSHKVLLLQSRAMQLHKLFQLAYDVHTCRMIPRLVIILKGDMYTFGHPKGKFYCVYITLTRRVEHLEQDKIAQALEITKLKQRVKKLEMRNKIKASKLKRLKKVGTAQKVETSDDTIMDNVSKQGRMIADMDADVDVTLKDIVKDVVVDAEINESAYVQGRQAESQAQIYQIDLEHSDKVLSMQDDEVEPFELQEVVEVVTTAKIITKVVTAASATITVAAPQLTTAAALTLTTTPSVARKRKGVVIRYPEETATPSTIIHTKAKSKDKRKGILEMTYDDIRPIFEKKFNSNVAFLQKIKEQMEEEDKLRKHLQIVPNDDDDDVYTEATPLTLKVPVVDYEIHTENNKPYYKIKRADGLH
nr:hypothetical protein [Tanacetum cinerariifolium]